MKMLGMSNVIIETFNVIMKRKWINTSCIIKRRWTYTEM